MKKLLPLALVLATSLFAQVKPVEDLKPGDTKVDPGQVVTNDTKVEPIAYSPIDTLKPGTITKPPVEAKPVEDGMALIEVKPQIHTVIIEDTDKIVTTSVTNLTVSPITVPLTQMQAIIDAIVKMGFQTSIPIDASKITSVAVTKDESTMKIFTTNATVSMVIDKPAEWDYQTNMVPYVDLKGETNMVEVVTPILKTPEVSHNETNPIGNVVVSYGNPVRFTVQVNLVP